MTEPQNAAPAAETCATCAAPLADDQRYCLNCGTRRGEPRMDPLAHLTLHREAPAVAETTEVVRPRGLLGGAALPLLGALAVLAALGVGVLIGSSGEDAPVISQRPPVVNITSAAGGPVAGTAATEAPSDEPSTAASKSKESDADRADAAKEAEDAVKKAGGAVLSKSELEATKKLSPEEARKRSAKLPSVVGTGGAPPAKDDKKPGAGSDAEVIK